MTSRKPLRLRFDEYIGKPGESITEAILSFTAEAKSHGEHPPFTDKTIIETLGVGNTADSPTTATITALAEDSQEIAGILLVALPTSENAAVGELAVCPRYRKGHAAEQLLHCAENSPFLKKKFSHLPGSVLDNTKFWAHGNSTAAQALAAKHNFSPARTVWKMRLADDHPSTSDAAPQGFNIRPFTIGQDEQAWITVNSKAFATHPEQGSVTLEELKAYEREDWFDPEGFFVAVNPDGTIVGFVWTKIEDTAGEIYVLGISPAAQGQGLGKFLARHGISYLKSRNVDDIFLHVDQDNGRAVELYRRNGFTLCDSDVMYSKP